MKRGVDIIHALLGTDRKREACAAWNNNPDRYGLVTGPMVWIDWRGWWLRESDATTGELRVTRIG